MERVDVVVVESWCFVPSVKEVRLRGGHQKGRQTVRKDREGPVGFDLVSALAGV